MRVLVASAALVLLACGGSSSGAGNDVTTPPRPTTPTDLERPFARDEEDAARSLLRSFDGLNVRRRSIHLGELMVGQRPDGIPSIDRPQFDGVEQAQTWLHPNEPVVLVERNGDARAYPLQILMWHEIVNDEVGGVPLAVTFCPLCNTAITLERSANDQVLEFGVSGLLRRSDLIMYDRQTTTLWQQITGEAIVGELAPSRLAFVPSAIVSFDSFADAHPTGRVLNRDTGHRRAYGSNPYVGYDEIGSSTLFPVREFGDRRLDAKERVLTVEAGGETVAFPFTTLSQRIVAEAEVGETPVVAFWQPGTLSPLDERFVVGSRNVGAAVAYRPLVDGRVLRFEARDGRIVDTETRSTWDILGRAVSGPLRGRTLEPVVSANHFWFAWVVFKPETRIIE